MLKLVIALLALGATANALLFQQAPSDGEQRRASKAELVIADRPSDAFVCLDEAEGASAVDPSESVAARRFQRLNASIAAISGLTTGQFANILEFAEALSKTSDVLLRRVKMHELERCLLGDGADEDDSSSVLGMLSGIGELVKTECKHAHDKAKHRLSDACKVSVRGFPALKVEARNDWDLTRNVRRTTIKSGTKGMLFDSRADDKMSKEGYTKVLGKATDEKAKHLRLSDINVEEGADDEPLTLRFCLGLGSARIKRLFNRADLNVLCPRIRIPKQVEDPIASLLGVARRQANSLAKGSRLTARTTLQTVTTAPIRTAKGGAKVLRKTPRFLMRNVVVRPAKIGFQVARLSMKGAVAVGKLMVRTVIVRPAKFGARMMRKPMGAMARLTKSVMRIPKAAVRTVIVRPAKFGARMMRKTYPKRYKSDKLISRIGKTSVRVPRAIFRMTVVKPVKLSGRMLKRIVK